MNLQDNNLLGIEKMEFADVELDMGQFNFDIDLGLTSL